MDRIGMMLMFSSFAAILIGAALAFLAVAKEFSEEKDLAGVCVGVGGGVSFLLLAIWLIYIGLH